jgi:hypothetical protein
MPLQTVQLRDRRRQGRLAMVDVTDRPTFTCGFVLSNFSFAIFPVLLLSIVTPTRQKALIVRQFAGLGLKSLKT